MRLFKTCDYFKKCNILTGWMAFLVAAVVYLLTIEPTASLWDCAEFIATSYKLEVGHPPGAPLFMMIARFFTMFAPSTEYVGMAVNVMSALCSAFTILFLFWTITHMGRRIYARGGRELTAPQTWAVMGAGLIGSLAYTFTDTFWFSAVEGEVYAMSSLFTAIVVWMMLRWEESVDEPRANRWLILIAYIMGLSIGVHILNLLTIPALVFIYYFRKTDKVTTKGAIYATLIAGAILLFINNIIIPYTTAIGAWFDRMFNMMGAPVNVGVIVFTALLIAALAFAVYITHKKGKVVLNTIALCVSVIVIGYGSYASVVIRAAANPPMNSNDPGNPYSLLYLLNRDQYGGKPLLFGAQYPAPVEDFNYKAKYYVGEDGKYVEERQVEDYVYPSEFVTLFPRMWSSRHEDGYREWGQIRDGRTVRWNGQRYTVPTAGENLRYFFSYQLNFMYWRYFLWNFVGRQSDNQSMGEITDGNWLSGIGPIDALYLGPQDNLPSEMAANKGRNTYYFLPFILGIVGLVYQLNRDPKNFTIVMWLFFMMGIALVLYFNTTPNEPRERDYVFAGSFYAFSVWIGVGVMAFRDWLAKLAKREAKWTAIAATAVCAAVPVILAAQNWDDHDRSHRRVTPDIGWNYLQSCLPNSIIMNYADNDTFPLWYNQEVQGVRNDVRIMNMSYLGGGWYVDQMKHRYNESDPVPFTLPKHKYMYNNDYIYVEDVFEGKAVTIRQAVDFIRSDDPRSRIRISEKTVLDFVPATTLLLPVNKENVLAAGIVSPEDAHLIVDTIRIDLTEKGTLDKPEMMLLDLLAHFDWSRPLYVTQPSSISGLGLHNYLQFDGYAYRLVPIYTPYQDSWNIGRIDPDRLYDNLMNVFRYGNVNDPRAYIDTYIQYNFNASQVRLAFARLANALTERGEADRAVEVLDYSMDQLPVREGQFRWSVQHIPIARAYYNAGAIDKGDEIVKAFSGVLMEYIDYFTGFPPAKQPLIMTQMEEKLTILAELHRTAEEFERTEIADEIRDFFYL